MILDCDASGPEVLSQYQNHERVISYGSHTLNQAQRKYCTTKRELYSVVYFVQHFKQYLLGRKFILRVDHQPLLWLCNFQDATGIFARWISILRAYEYDLVFRQDICIQMPTPCRESQTDNALFLSVTIVNKMRSQSKSHKFMNNKIYMNWKFCLFVCLVLNDASTLVGH